MFNHWPYSGLPALPTIHTASLECVGLTAGLNVGSAYVTTAYSAINRAFFIPFHVEMPIPVTKLFISNGAVLSGNFDVGIYSSDFTRLTSSGSTAQAGANDIQAVDITDITIGPGDFYLAISMDNVTAQLLRGSPSAVGMRRCGCMQQDSGSFPLPATATPISPSTTYLPMIGLLQGGTVI